jgi:hypothetical protein
MTGEESVTDVILREIRELGESIILIDQCPHLISPIALANTYTTICMNLKLGQDVMAISKAMLLDFEEKNYFGTLKTGEAIVKLQDRWLTPFMLKIPEIKVQKGRITDEVIKIYMSNHSSYSTSNTQPISEQPSVPAQPNEDKSGLESVKLSEQEKSFLIDVFKNPLSGIVQRYLRLNISRRKGTDCKEDLITKSLLIPVEISLKYGQIMLFEFTDKAKDWLKNQGFEFNTPSKEGGIEHRYWVHKVADYYKKKGLQVEIEKDIGDWNSVDIEVVNANQQKIAFGIETGKSDIKKNVDKAMEKGYHKFIIVPVNQKAKEKVKKLEIVNDKDILCRDWLCYC